MRHRPTAAIGQPWLTAISLCVGALVGTVKWGDVWIHSRMPIVRHVTLTAGPLRAATGLAGEYQETRVFGSTARTGMGGAPATSRTCPDAPGVLNNKWFAQESLDHDANFNHHSHNHSALPASTGDTARLYCQCARRWVATGPGVLDNVGIGRSIGWSLFPEACGDACGCTPATGQGQQDLNLEGEIPMVSIEPILLPPPTGEPQSQAEIYFREAGLVWPTTAEQASVMLAQPKLKGPLPQSADDPLPWDMVGLAEASYKFIVEEEPPTRCSAGAMPPPELRAPCPKAANRSVLAAMMLVNEVDTLEMMLAEYTGLADVLITENRQVHNPKIKTEKPHLLWPRLMATDRFKPFLSRGTKIFFHECTQRATKVGVIGTSGIQLAVDRWEAERLDTACLSDKVKEMAADYQVVIVGSVDELTARKNIHDLKHCAELKPMPRGSAIAMPYGMIGRSYHPDFHYPNWTTGFALPTFYSPNGDTVKGSPTLGQFRRYAQTGMKFHPPPNSEPVVGGMHLTMYCYLPAMVLKEAWITDHPGLLDMGAWCSKPIDEIKDQLCYGKKATSMGYGLEHIVPYALALCPDSFPSWYGKVDPREEAFYRRMCGGHTSEQWKRLEESVNNTGFVEPHPGHDCAVPASHRRGDLGEVTPAIPATPVSPVTPMTEEQCRMKCVMEPVCTGVSFDRAAALASPPAGSTADAAAAAAYESPRPAQGDCKLLSVKVTDCAAAANGNWVFSEKKKWQFHVVKPGFDCVGGDIREHSPTSLYEIQSICAKDPNCTGFSFKGGRSWRANPKFRRSRGCTRHITMESCKKALVKSNTGWEFWWRHDASHGHPEPSTWS